MSVKAGDTMVLPSYTVYGFMLLSDTLFTMGHIVDKGETGST
jgi:hypothetical protein